VGEKTSERERERVNEPLEDLIERADVNLALKSTSKPSEWPKLDSNVIIERARGAIKLVPSHARQLQDQAIEVGLRSRY